MKIYLCVKFIYIILPAEDSNRPINNNVDGDRSTRMAILTRGKGNKTVFIFMKFPLFFSFFFIQTNFIIFFVCFLDFESN